MPRILFNRSTRVQRLLDELPEIELDELRELLRLIDLVDTDGGNCPTEVLADQPVHVGNMCLYRPSIGAIRFMSSTARWFDGDSFFTRLWHVWILQHSRQPAVLLKVTTPRQAEARMARMLDRCGVTVQELFSAASAAMDGFPEIASAKSKGANTDTLAFASMFMEKLGGTVDHWVWEESLSRALWIPRSLETIGAGDDGPSGRMDALQIQRDYITQLQEKYCG